MKNMLSIPGSLFISTLASIILAFIFPVDFVLGAMGVTFGWMAIGKIGLAYQFLTERITSKKTDVFRIPLWFFIYLLVMVALAVGLLYLAFFKFDVQTWHQSTVNNLRFFTSAMGFSLFIGILRWIEVRKTLRITWETVNSKIIGTIHLPVN